MRDSNDLNLVARQQPIDECVGIVARKDKAAAVRAPGAANVRGPNDCGCRVLELEKKAPSSEGTAFGVPVARCESVFDGGGVPPRLIRSH